MMSWTEPMMAQTYSSIGQEGREAWGVGGSGEKGLSTAGVSCHLESTWLARCRSSSHTQPCYFDR